jgi:DNA polymerase (family 10)
MNNREIAKVFNEVADILEIKGENFFRVRSYRLAAESVAASSEDLAGRLRRGEPLRGLPGIGEGMTAKIRELVEHGVCAYHQELLAEVPHGLLDLLRLPGLGPKGVNLVWTRLGVQSLDDLEAAIADGRFRTLPGMKEKKEARIRKGLQERKAAAVRILLPPADALVSQLATYLREHGAARVEAVGSYRRRRDTVGDLDLIVVAEHGDAVSDAFTRHPEVKEVLSHGGAKTSVVLNSGLQVDLRPFAAADLGAALQYFTGSKAHNVALRERALRRKLKLNEYGVWRVEDATRVAGATEEEVYAALGLALVPPELREDRGEIEAAAHGSLPRLVELSDVQGDLHAHTIESDGRDTLEAMVDAARLRGLRYLAITDHSRSIPSPKQGRGMDETRCLQHAKRVRALQHQVGDIRLLTGIEVDILPDGTLDMADEVLAQLDVVVASLHSQLNMEAPAMTDRLLRAFENPHLDVWGHPMSRKLLKRDPIAVDLDAVLAAAARHGVALEINCQPDRLDLPDHLVRPARDKGIRFVISTDSHATHHLANLAYGVGQARRGWLTAEDVLNTRDADRFLAALRH